MLNYLLPEKYSYLAHFCCFLKIAICKQFCNVWELNTVQVFIHVSEYHLLFNGAFSSDDIRCGIKFLFIFNMRKKEEDLSVGIYIIQRHINSV